MKVYVPWSFQPFLCKKCIAGSWHRNGIALRRIVLILTDILSWLRALTSGSMFFWRGWGDIHLDGWLGLRAEWLGCIGQSSVYPGVSYVGWMPAWWGRGDGDVRHFWVGDMTRSWGEWLYHIGEIKRGGWKVSGMWQSQKGVRSLSDGGCVCVFITGGTYLMNRDEPWW